MTPPHRLSALRDRARSTSTRRINRADIARKWTRFCQSTRWTSTRRRNASLTSLAATGRSPVDLLSELYFVDADEAIQCRKGDAVVALTTPGGRVIHMCGKRFIRPALSLKVGEIVLIHELLQRTRTRREPTDRHCRLTGTVASRPRKFDRKRGRDDKEMSTLGRLCNCGMRVGKYWLDRFRRPGPILERCLLGPRSIPCSG
jgi:hypothetical protein